MRHPRSLAPLASSTALTLVLMATPGVTLAQDQTITLAPIIITGEKVVRSLKRTAASVAALAGEQVARDPAAHSVTNALAEVPNVNVTGTVAAPIIRGQDSQGPNSGAGAFFGGTVPRATINVDGRYLSYNEYALGAASAWDVQSVEVFRGPQTTTQGANSIAGAILVKTNDPTFEREGVAQLQYGSRNSRRASFAVSGPLSSELAARLAVDGFARDTFITYTNPNFRKGNTDQDFENRDVRFKLLWRPADLPGLEAKLTFSHTSSNRPSLESASTPFEDLNNDAIAMPTWRNRTNSMVADVSYDFGNGMALHNQLQISDRTNNRYTAPVTDGTARLDQRTVSNETRLTFGGDEDTISGVAGLFVARTTSDEMLDLRDKPADFITRYDDTKTNLGVYGEATWRLADRWRLTGGLRYQRDEISRSGVATYAKGPLDYNGTFDAWLPKLALSYDASETTTVGAMISQGYNPGGVSLDLRRGSYVAFAAERVTSYELFARSQMLEDRLMLSGNLFYSDYKDAQRFVRVVLPNNYGSSVTVNAEQAKAYGLELAADYQASDTLRLRGGLGLLHTEVSQFSAATSDILGKEFARAPRHSLTFGVDWTPIDKLTVNASVRHTGGYFSDDTNSEATRIDSFTLANLRVSYVPREGIEVYGYANNLFDERAPLAKQLSRSATGPVMNAIMTEPREVGIGLRMTF
ncbi:TonB-dependent receptor [Paracoccus sp. p4-l81]|uniref:TonB-dependent receptor n=1 Tax=unclassified Paracoccus (in: a-proteobacteria) TaxID=2688777 RepID=UPI0035BA1E5B